MEKISLEQFCEKFAGYDDDATIMMGVFGYQNGDVYSHRSCDIKMTCEKKDIDIYNSSDMIRVWLDTNDFCGSFFDIKVCEWQKDGISTDYRFLDVKGRIVFWVAVLNE